jgi:LacI family transcriptional regulator
MPAGARSKPTRPTIQAIASKAGVSRATVSLILANREDVVRRFKPDTVERVRRVADEMGYHANLMAISLRSPHPSFFGLILRGPGRADVISWHHQAFEGQFLAGALEASRALQLYPVLATQDSPDPEGALTRVRGVLDGGVCGAVFRTPVPVLDEAIRHQVEQGLPVAIVFPEHPTDCVTNAIDVDNVAAGRLAGRLLHDAGRRRWIMIREEVCWEAIRLREQGIQASAQEVGASLYVLDVPSGIGERETMQWLAPKLRAYRPDGVYSASSVSAVGALLACQQAGLKVPDDTCLIGSDASLWRAPGCPGITSIDVSWYDAGELAVRKVTELRDEGESTFETILLPPRIRKGESCPGGEEEPAEVLPQDL